MGSKVQSSVGCFPELCFIQLFVAQVFVGLRKQFINNFVFLLGPVLLILIIINNRQWVCLHHNMSPAVYCSYSQIMLINFRFDIHFK